MPLIPRKATQTGRLRRKPAIRDGLKAREKAPKAYDESRPCGVARPALWTTKKAPCLTSSPHLSQFIVCRTIIDAIASGFSPCAIGSVQVQRFGVSVLQRLAVTDPGKLAQIAYGLLPRDVFISVEQRTPGNLDAEEWQILRRVIDLIKQNAGGAELGPVLETIENALRADQAKMIEAE